MKYNADSVDIICASVKNKIMFMASNFLTWKWNWIMCALHQAWLTLSMIFWKCTSTVQLWMSGWLSELWIRTDSFFERIFWALYPNTNSMESITLDLPLPFGPMMQEKRWWQKGLNRMCWKHIEALKITINKLYINRCIPPLPRKTQLTLTFYFKI